MGSDSTIGRNSQYSLSVDVSKYSNDVRDMFHKFAISVGGGTHENHVYAFTVDQMNRLRHLVHMEAGDELRPVQCEPSKPTPTPKPNKPCPCGSPRKYKKCCRRKIYDEWACASNGTNGTNDSHRLAQIEHREAFLASEAAAENPQWATAVANMDPDYCWSSGFDDNVTIRMNNGLEVEMSRWRLEHLALLLRDALVNLVTV